MRRSVLSCHLVAPGTVHSDSNEVVPSISQGSHAADLARDRLRSDQWVTSDDAWFPIRLTLWAVEGGLIKTIKVAEFTGSGRQGISNSTVHVNLQNPITNLVSFCLTK